MAITLGKDCTIRVGSGTVVGVRNVTLSESARTIEVNAFGSRYAAVYSTGYDCSVQIELNDPAALGAAFTALHQGSRLTVSGGAGNFSFQAVVTGITETDPIDGVVTCTIEAKMTHPSLR